MRIRLLPWMVLVLSVLSCRAARAPVPAIPQAPPSVAAVQPPAPEPEVPQDIEIIAPEINPSEDVEIGTPFISPEEETLPPHPAVEQAVQFYADSIRGKFQAALDRFGPLRPMIQRTFEAEGAPPELIYITLTESLCQSKARSRVGAYGMWQFMKGTARLYHLKINSFIDERAQTEKATRAAAQYLKNSMEELGGDLLLTIASYNCGTGNVQRAIRKCGGGDFWAIRPCLPKETRNFVPSVLAAAEIANNPATYGFSYSEQAPDPSEAIAIPTSANLKKLAQKANVPLEEILQLNPELRGKYTPPEGYLLQVPAGTKEALLAGIPIHIVQEGESLTRIAADHKVNPALVAKVNELSLEDVLTPGQRLYIPESVTEGYHTVQAGESPYTIARHYGIPLERFLEANGMTKRVVLHPGQQLKVPGIEGETVLTQRKYKVHRGDTLAKIARRFSTTVDRLKTINNLNSENLTPGHFLIIE